MSGEFATSLVVDFGDDFGAAFRYAVEAGVVDPSLTKEGSWVDRTKLRDGDFGLIIVDENRQEHRKFACYDKGSTFLSLWYLENVDSGLPEHAKIAAAENLTRAAEVYELPLDEMFPSTMKMSRASGNHPFRTRSWSDGTIKVGSAERLDERRVFVDSRAMSREVATKVASATASEESPFDKIAQAEARWDDLTPWERRVVALNLNIPDYAQPQIPAKIAAYAAEDWNPEMEARIKHRMLKIASSDEARENYERIYVMSAAGRMEKEAAVEAMFLQDELCGIHPERGYGPNLPDPYLCVYGEPAKEASWSWTRGAEYLTEDALTGWAASALARVQMKELFDEDLLKKFRSNPIKTFEGLTTPQKTMIARMASQTSFAEMGAFRP